MKHKNIFRVGLIMPHIFMHEDILPHVIFAPGHLALNLAEGLAKEAVEVTLFTPGPIKGNFKNVTADLSYFEAELAARGDSYLDLLKKHPFTFITLARQVQSEIIAKAFTCANNNEIDVVHVYSNEEDTALPFATFCKKPVVFTHHDPYNFLIKYRSTFPKYKDLNWLSISKSQRTGMPNGTHWVENIYHGLDPSLWKAKLQPGSYVAYLGRIIKPKGLHLAIEALKKYNQNNPESPLILKIAGKHYTGSAKDSYWKKIIEPELNNPFIEYVGFIKDREEKQRFLSNAKALLVPSIFDEPFGMVMIESLACGTPVIGLNSGAIAEVIKDGENGYLVKKTYKKTAVSLELNEQKIAKVIVMKLIKIDKLDRKKCRQDFEMRFTLEAMVKRHIKMYRKLSIK